MMKYPYTVYAQAMPRKTAIDLLNSHWPKIMEHLLLLLIAPKNNARDPWVVEVTAQLDRIADIRIKPQNRPPNDELLESLNYLGVKLRHIRSLLDLGHIRDFLPKEVITDIDSQYYADTLLPALNIRLKILIPWLYQDHRNLRSIQREVNTLF